jgi:hypothetical protein
MKNPLSVFSFGQIPTQWQQKKQSGAKCTKGLLGTKMCTNCHILREKKARNR